MPYKEKKIEKVYFTIQEACDVINEQIHIRKPADIIVPSTLRYWESRCSILGATKLNSKGVRKYSRTRVKDIILFTNIMHTGWYTVEGAIREFKKAKNYIKADEQKDHWVV
jgi:hypothetical protein